MFVRTVRNSFSGNNEEAAIKIFREKMKPLWSKQPGFHSLSRFNILDGPHKDKQMVVMRFESKDAFDKAMAAVAKEREGILKEITAAGITMEEVMLLDEIAE